MAKNEARLEGRFLCAELVRITWRRGEELREMEAVLEDISPLGACVQVEEEIPAGASVTLSASGRIFSGTVSYCVYRDYGYFAGIRLSDETHWSRQLFAPEHLVNLQTLGSGPSCKRSD